MELTNEFRVAVPVDRAWDVLTDVERIAPCLPGAQLQEIEGDEYRGVVKVKVGPITAQYKGAATFQEQDRAANRIVLKAEGRDTRGQGNASAIITAELSPSGDETEVTVTTDLTITGRVAQFGRGVLGDVSAKLLGQFVECLEATVLADDEPDRAEPAEEPEVEAAEPARAAEPADQPAPVDAPAVPGPSSDEIAAAEEPDVARAPSPTAPPRSAPPTVRKIDTPEAAPVDLLDSAGAPVLKRLAPIVTAVVLLLFLGRRRRRRRGRG